MTVIHATWYKVYAAFVTTVALAAIVDSALETRTLKSSRDITDPAEFYYGTVMGNTTCILVAAMRRENYNI